MKKTQLVWSFLRVQSGTKRNIINETGIDISKLNIYIKALKSAGYLVEQEKQMKLIKDTGEIAPKLSKNRSVVYDFNTLEEHLVFSAFNNHPKKRERNNLEKILKGIIHSKKNFLFQKEIVKASKTKGNSPLLNWKDLLLSTGVILKTDKFDGLSQGYNINIDKCIRFAELLAKYYSQTIAIEKFKKEVEKWR